jgi:hypothetical protein
MPYNITKFEEALHLIGALQNKRVWDIVRRLEREGCSEKSISFAIYKSQEKILTFKGDGRFYSVLENEIRKWSWAKSDPRWIEYNKRRALI